MCELSVRPRVIAYLLSTGADRAAAGAGGADGADPTDRSVDASAGGGSAVSLLRAI